MNRKIFEKKKNFYGGPSHGHGNPSICLLEPLALIVHLE